MIMKLLQNSTTNKNRMKNVLVILVSLFLSLSSFAQHPGKDKEEFERYKAQRISYMTEKMELTPEEAQKFWPIYNEYDSQRGELHFKKRNLERRVKDEFDKLSTKDFEKINNEIVSIYMQEAELVKTFNERFKKVLPVSKVVLIGPTENEFRFKMIREFRNKEREKEEKKQ